MSIYLGSNIGAFWKHLWAILAAFKTILGRRGAIWEALETILGSLEANWMCLNISQAHFGVILEYLGAILGPFASVLGSLCNLALPFRPCVATNW